MSDTTLQTAAEARRFLALNRTGMLATISKSMGGAPFGSVTPYDMDSNGDLMIYVSLIAEHYKNLVADPRASLVAIDYFAASDPQASSRATAICTFAPVGESEQEAIAASYFNRFPSAENHEIAHNFLFMRGTVERVRWIGGFGDIAWVSADKYHSAPEDPLARPGFEIIEHMNTDHFDAVQKIARAIGLLKNSHNAPALMCDVDSRGITLIVGAKRVRTDFTSPAATPSQARDRIIELLRRAESGGAA